MALQTVTIPRVLGGTLLIQVDIEQPSSPSSQPLTIPRVFGGTLIFSAPSVIVTPTLGQVAVSDALYGQVAISDSETT